MSLDTLTSLGFFRGVIAAVLLVLFIALWLWAYSRHRRPVFDALAELPLEDDAFHTVPSRGKVQ